jgi:hypothetical protein
MQNMPQDGRNEQRSQVNLCRFFQKRCPGSWIETDKEGMHKISPSQLSFLNLGDIDPSSFRLFTTGGYGMGTSIIQSGFEFREVTHPGVIGADDGRTSILRIICILWYRPKRSLQKSGLYQFAVSQSNSQNGVSGSPMQENIPQRL